MPADPRVKEYEKAFLFHGSGEPIEGELRPGAFDKVLWTAESSAVAQSYIPAAGSTTLVSFSAWELRDDAPLPAFASGTPLGDDLWKQDVPVAMGFLARARSPERGTWTDLEGQEVPYAQQPRPSDVVTFLEGLGYDNEGASGWRAWVKVHRGGVLAANENAPGSLFILRGKDGLNLLDASSGDPASLLDPQYLHLDLFEAAEDAGYDGVIVDDLLQSKWWGNFGHQSVGLFPRGIRKLSLEAIPASNFDSRTVDGWNEPTPEFEAYAVKRLKI